MELAVHEFPLTFFTTLAPLGAGAFFMLALSFCFADFSKDQLKKIVAEAEQAEKEMGENEPAAPYDEEGYLEVIAKGEDASMKKHKEEGNNGTGSN